METSTGGSHLDGFLVGVLHGRVGFRRLAWSHIVEGDFLGVWAPDELDNTHAGAFVNVDKASHVKAFLLRVPYLHELRMARIGHLDIACLDFQLKWKGGNKRALLLIIHATDS